MSFSKLKSEIHATYASALSKRKSLNADQQKELFEKKDNGDMKARNKLIEGNLRLAVSVALRSKVHKNSSMDIMDVISMANIGLIKAVDKFEHNKGFKFSTYAFWWINEAIERTSSNENSLVYIPFDVSQKIKVVHAIANRLSNELSRAATHEEIAAEAKLTASKVAKLLSYSYTMVSGEDKEEDSTSEFDTISSDENIEDKISKEQITDRIKAAINSKEFSDKERMIINSVYEIDTEVRTLGEIGAIVNLSRERVRQISVNTLAAITAQLSDIEGVVPVVKIARKKKKVVALEALDLIIADIEEEVMVEAIEVEIEAMAVHEEVISVDLSTTAIAEELSDMVVAIASEPLKSLKVSFELLPLWNDQRLKNNAQLWLSTATALLDTEVNLYEPLRNTTLHNSEYKAHSRHDIGRHEYQLASDQRSVLSASISALLAVPDEPLALSNTLMSGSGFISSATCLKAKNSSWTNSKRKLINSSPGRTNDAQFQAKVIAIEDMHNTYLDTIKADKGSLAVPGELLDLSHTFRSRKGTLTVSEQSIIKFPEKPPARPTDSRLARRSDVFYQTAFSPGSAFERHYSSA